MIGRLEVEPPPADDEVAQMVESHQAQTGQDYHAILLFGLWGTVDCSPEVRLYAAYQHLKDKPEDGPAWIETARAHAEAEEVDQALAIIDELIRLDKPGLYPGIYSEDPEAVRAHILADAGRLDEALEAFDGLRARHQDSPVYHYATGSVLHEKGDFAAAVASYDEAGEALEQFRQDVLEEDMADEIAVDFPAAAGFIDDERRAAGDGRGFSGERPLDLSGFTRQ